MYLSAYYKDTVDSGVRKDCTQSRLAVVSGPASTAGLAMTDGKRVQSLVTSYRMSYHHLSKNLPQKGGGKGLIAECHFVTHA